MQVIKTALTVMLTISMIGIAIAGEMKVSKSGEYSLMDFGKVAKVGDAQKTYG